VPDSLSDSPRQFPLSLDVASDTVRLVNLDETSYRQASFLDERLLTETGSGKWVPFQALEDVARDLDRESDFIFHMGHVGSTLVARVLGGHEAVFCLREPAILRTLAIMSSGTAVGGGLWDAPTLARRARVFARLNARVWRPTQRGLVKATSFVTDIAEPMMAALPSAKAILMFTPPLVHMATLLAGFASRRELGIAGPGRLSRLRRRLGGGFKSAVETMSEGELAALAWACEIVALHDVADRFPGRSLWLNFETFLNRPEDSLRAALLFLHGHASDEALAALLASPDFTRYSKDQAHAYDAGARAEVLTQARQEHAAELDRGLNWLNAAGNAHALIANAARAAAASNIPT
jgi:hypothetical protein